MFLKENYVKSLQTCFIKQYFRIIPWGYFIMKQIFIAHFWEKLEIAILPVRFVQSSWSFLVTCTRLYTPLCWSIGLSVRLSVRLSVHHTWLFSSVLRDSTPRFVGPLVCPSVGPLVRRSITLYFFWVLAVFGLTAPAQMIKWPQMRPLPTRTRLG